MQYYTSNNRTGALIAKQLKWKEVKSKIAYLQDPGKGKITNPQHIADEFAKYYEGLYNLTKDPTADLPDPVNTDFFLRGLGYEGTIGNLIGA